MKTVNLFFEVEDFWDGSKYYDPNRGIDTILGILDDYGFKAVFFVSGLTSKEIIEKIKKKGHEIGFHGYKHENFGQLDEKGIIAVIDKTEKAIGKLEGFRLPIKACNEMIEGIFKSKGYKYSSNVHTVFPESFKFVKYIVSLLNYYLNYPKKPYKVNGLLEIPIMSSYERDLLEMIAVNQETPDKWIKFAVDSLKKQYKRSGDYFNLNFHTWAIASANRQIILKSILEFIAMKKAKVVLARDLL